MHELSIAMSILDVVEEESARHGEGRVTAVHLKLGPLSGVVREALLASFEMAREGTPLEGCELIIEEVPIVIDCPVCQGPRAVVSVQQMCCSTCGAPADNVTAGRDLEVFAMELDG